MGRWMEALNNKHEMVMEMAPNFLIYCSRHLPKPIRSKFPLLLGLELYSKTWVAELQVFDPTQISELKNELLLVYNIINMKVYIQGVDAKKIIRHWTSDDYQLKDINKDIDDLILFFNKAIQLELNIEISL